MQLAVDLQFSHGGKRFLTASFSIMREKSHVSVLFGPSGAGKTTLLHAIAGIALPVGIERFTPDTIQVTGSIYQGEIGWFDSEKGIVRTPHKRSVGFLFQDYSLFPHLTVSENIAYGLPRESDLQQEVSAWLRRFHLEEKGDDLPGQLSGGERQRAALAQTLAPRPSLVLLDEPFSALDRPTRRELLREVRNWLPSNNVSAIAVLHDLDDAICLGDELLIMAEGKILQAGKPEEIAGHPTVPAVAQILGFENLLPAYVVSAYEGELLLEISPHGEGGEGGERGERGKSASDSSQGVATLSAVGTGQIGDPYYAAIQADDILLESGSLGQGSARNRLAGRVIEVMPMGLKFAVRVDCGFRLTAHITKRSAAEMNVAPGKPMTAVIKASSIRLIPR